MSSDWSLDPVQGGDLPWVGQVQPTGNEEWTTKIGTSLLTQIFTVFTRLSHFRRIVNSSEEETVDLHRLASLALRGSFPDHHSINRIGE
jgi:hypothetical protein